jgi:hypothetical protein
MSFAQLKENAFPKTIRSHGTRVASRRELSHSVTAGSAGLAVQAGTVGFEHIVVVVMGSNASRSNPAAARIVSGSSRPRSRFSHSMALMELR